MTLWLWGKANKFIDYDSMFTRLMTRPHVPPFTTTIH